MPILPQEVKYGEDNPIEAVPVLTEEEKHTLAQKMKALDQILAKEGRAKYKLEVMFGKAYSLQKASIGALTFWESGKMFHGGGDTKLYVCPGKKLGMNECETFIPSESQGYGFLVCPGCKQVWKGDDATGEVMCRLTTMGWADVLLKYFLKMQMNADIRIKYHPDDIRSVAKREQDKQLGGEKLEEARDRRATRIYPLLNLVKDTSNGADLCGRIMAFLKA